MKNLLKNKKINVIMLAFVAVIFLVIGVVFFLASMMILNDKKENKLEGRYSNEIHQSPTITNLVMEPTSNNNLLGITKSIIINQASISGELEAMYEITFSEERSYSLNEDKTDAEIDLGGTTISIFTQIDSTGGTFESMPEVKEIEQNTFGIPVWRIIGTEYTYYTSFFEINGTDSCVNYGRSDYDACGTDRIDITDGISSGSIFIACNSKIEEEILLCDEFISKELEVKFL